MGKYKLKIFEFIILCIITINIGIIMFINNKQHNVIISKNIIEPYTVTLEKSNCTISEENYVAIIKKYNGSAEAIIIDSNITDCSKVEINKHAFLECTNLETILIEKSLVSENLEIEEFERNIDYIDEQYIMYTTTREYGEAYRQYLELSEEEKNVLEIIPNKYEVSMAALYTESMEENYNVSEILSEEIPESFDLRDKIDIKVENQGSTGTCYSYASLTAVETNVALINKDYIDLSEVHQGFLTYGYNGSFISANDSYYADKIGPVYEKEWSMERILGDEKDETAEIIYEYLIVDSAEETMNKEELQNVQEILKQTKSKKYVTETVNIPSIPKDDDTYSKEDIEAIRNVIKTHIMKYGSLFASVATHDMTSKNNVDLLNSKSSSLYRADHAVSIIGWDDNFPKENFPVEYQPENNGAYLVLNSYGEEWGNKGCFWVSYEDKWIETELNGVISVEDVQENIIVNSVKIKDTDANEEISVEEIIKGKNIQLEFNLNVNEVKDEQYEFIIDIIAPNGENIANQTTISGNCIENNVAQILIDFNTRMLDVGTYTINLEYGNEIITRTIEINNNTFDYKIKDDGTIAIKSYHGEDTDIIIPKKFLGYEVTEILKEAFINNNLYTITIYDNIINIGDNIISSSTIIYGNEGTYIESYANENGYKFIDLNKDVIEGTGWYFNIDEHKLYITENTEEKPYEYLKDIVYTVELKSPVDKILDNQFEKYRRLQEAILPSSIISIGKYAYNECNKLQIINLPDELISIGKYAFTNCESLTNIQIPERVTVIDTNIFAGCNNIINIGIPDSVTHIGENAFCECYNLSNINIPKTVSIIEKGAFANCEKLMNVEIPEGITSINQDTFKGCMSLINVKIPQTVTSIEDYAFYHCTSLENIELPTRLTDLGAFAFRKCEKLTSITIPKGVTTINNCTFAECIKLIRITLPEGLTSIGNHAFWSCVSLEGIEIPRGVTDIKRYAFYSCENLKSIKMPEKLTTIGEYAFHGCESLLDLEIPDTVTFIGESAFSLSRINKVIKTGTTTIQEIELPNIIKRAMNENDILYCNEKIYTYYSKFNNQKNKLEINTRDSNRFIYGNLYS